MVSRLGKKKNLFFPAILCKVEGSFIPLLSDDIELCVSYPVSYHVRCLLEMAFCDGELSFVFGDVYYLAPAHKKIECHTCKTQTSNPIGTIPHQRTKHTIEHRTPIADRGRRGEE
jgi:hypothetical protein